MAQVVGLLTGRVATAHDSHDLLAVEEAVAGRAGRYALPCILRLVGQAQVLGCGTRGHDDGVSRQLLAAVQGDEEGALAHVDACHEARLHLRAQVDGLLAHVVHQLEAVNALGEAGEILDGGRLGQLSAHLQALDEQAVDGGAHQINRCGISGRAGTDNQTLGVVHIFQFLVVSCQLSVVSFQF